MLSGLYFDANRRILEKIEETQTGNIERAADAIVASVKSGGCVHIFDTGHLISSEAFNRAGGLVLMRPLNYQFRVENPARQRPVLSPEMAAEAEAARQSELARAILGASAVRKGDVLIIGSVSGKAALPVALALSARELGVVVIAITAVAYSAVLDSEHPSGRRLYESVDIVVDNCAPPGDAMVSVRGLEPAICPASGVAAAVIIWALTAEIVERLLAAGYAPQVLKSINRPGSREWNEAAYAAYERNGY